MSFRVDPRLPLEDEIRRIAAEQIDKAAAELSGVPADRHAAIHEARKRFKKLRALFRLVRHGNEAFYQTENARFRDLAGALSGARDRAALVEAIDALLASQPDDAADVGLKTMREKFAARRDSASEPESDLNATLDGLAKARVALSDLTLPQTHKSKKAARFVAAGFRVTFGQARRALKLARASGEAGDLHVVRRHLKYHGAHLQLLLPLWPDFLGPLRVAADRIADALGEDHDLFVLRTELAAHPVDLGPTASLEGLLALINHRQNALRATGFGLARRLLAEEPDAVEARIERLFRLAALAAAQDAAAGSDTAY